MFLMFIFSGNLLANDCYRGTLDKQYCDRNRDMVADLPLDSSKWVNPKTIIFKAYSCLSRKFKNFNCSFKIC